MPGKDNKKGLASDGLGIQNIAIFVIVILTFFGSAFLFWRINTNFLRKSIEAETKLSASLLADDIMKEIPMTAMTFGTYNETLLEELSFLEDKIENDSDVWIFNGKGRIFSKNGKSETGDFFAETGLSTKKNSCLETVKKTGTCTLWAGKPDLLLLHRKCCVLRSLYGGEMFLAVLDHGNKAKELQRQQFALLMVIDILLVLVMIVLIVNNITKYRKQLIRYATTDELTGLANRKYFNTVFPEYIQNEQFPEVSLFLLDIDFFKQINDNYGHAAGDYALRYLGQKIRAMMKEMGGFAGRWGGDEFIGVIPHPAEEAYEALNRLCTGIAATDMEGGFRMSISVGVAAAGNERSLVKLSEKADLALYESKEHGRNQVSLYRDEMKAAASLQEVRPESRVDRVGKAVAQGETFRISEKSRTEKTAASTESRKPFKQRLFGYIQEKLIMSTILGVRWMAPFVAGGGILIALAFLFDALSVDLSSLTVAERANFGSITSTAATLKTIGGNTFNFMLPVFAGFMAYGIAGEEAFMTGFVGGYMTINSNSGFVGGMIAGFIAGVITNEIRQFTIHLPGFIRKAAPIIIFPVFNLLLMQMLSLLLITPVSSAVGRFFTQILETLSTYSQVAQGAFSAMMMATDMGGIINKVAYNYGVNAISSGNTGIMAAVMIGGMVPPVGIFFSMLLFRDKYTEAERDRGLGTLFMGLSFITEGALPFVFTDFLRVIPSCMLGSAVAGMLSELFGCTLPAPHGGMFVFPVMRHPLLYAIALLLGSLVTAVVLGKWKKKAEVE